MSEAPARDWIKLGTIGKAHGLRGAFFISGRDTPIPKSYKTLRVGTSPEDSRACDILETRMQGDRPVLILSIASDRTAIETMTGQALWVERQSVTIDETKEYLWHDLIGRQVLDDAGTTLGVVETLYNTGATDVLTVLGPRGKRVDIPLVGTYLAMDFGRDTGPLSLRVPASTFDEMWE